MGKSPIFINNSQLKVLMIFASQLPPRLVQHQRLEEQGADLVATGLTKLGCAISFGSQMDDYTMLHGIQNGHHFSSFWGDLCTFDTNMWTEWNFPRRASHIEFCAQHHRPNLWLLCYLFATYSLLYSLFDAVFSAIPKSSTFQCNAGAWIFRRAISSIQQENPILGEHCTANREVSWRLILTGEKTEQQKNAWDIHRWPIDTPWLNPM